MRHADHVELLRPAAPAPGGAWADLGAGTGAFTLALRELVGAGATIHAVDKDNASLLQLQSAFRRRFGETEGLRLVRADLRKPPKLPALDGVLMANSLHFFRDRIGILRAVRGLLKPGGLLLVVEYNVDRGNPWVPHPLSFETFRDLTLRAGFSEPRLLGKHPSGFLQEFYSAAADTP
jgi:ubiquinone/menaquinone biosynthesis C-methylase UbiE